jgi:hypothetical protein
MTATEMAVFCAISVPTIGCIGAQPNTIMRNDHVCRECVCRVELIDWRPDPDSPVPLYELIEPS